MDSVDAGSSHQLAHHADSYFRTRSRYPSAARYSAPIEQLNEANVSDSISVGFFIVMTASVAFSMGLLFGGSLEKNRHCEACAHEASPTQAHVCRDEGVNHSALPAPS
jgi:hypothetical protein